MKFTAIDPGTTESAYVVLDDMKVVEHAKIPNEEMLLWCYKSQHVVPESTVVIEKVASYGMAVGAEVFETCVWTGRFMEALIRRGVTVDRMTRPQVKMMLCHKTAGVNDAVIRQALIDMYGPGKEKAIGNKAKPGPLYGIKADQWAALALGVAWDTTE